MTESFLAIRTGDGALVVMKQLLPRFAAIADKYVLAARQSAELIHPNIGAVLDVSDDGVVVTEYVSGEDLRFILDESARHSVRLPVAISCAIVAEVARALEYAHGQRGRGKGMVHRDVCPTNIVVTHEGRTKLVDFAVMKALPQEAYADPAVVRGKLPYFSPEHVSGRTPEARSDLFSLGAVFHEMLTSRRLFAGPSDAAILRNVVERNLPPPGIYNPDVPAELDGIVLGLLSRDLATRTPSARALLDELEAVMSRWPVSARDPEAIAAWMGSIFEARRAARLELEEDVRAGRPAVERADFTSAETSSRPGVTSSGSVGLGLVGNPIRAAVETTPPPLLPPMPAPAAGARPRRRGTTLLLAASLVAAALAITLVVVSRGGADHGAAAVPSSVAPTDGAAAVPVPEPAVTASAVARTAATDRADGERTPAVATAPVPDHAPAAPDPDVHDRAARSRPRQREEREEPRSNLGVLVIAYEPASAQVSIDGESQGGASPLRMNLRPGSYTVRVSAPDFQTWSREIAVTARRTATATASLERDRPRLAEIDIRSSPGGAEVRVDGAVRGVTPLIGLKVTPGRQMNIELTRAGYEPWTGNATGSSAEKLSLTVPLVKRTAVAAAPPPPVSKPAPAPSAPRTVSASQMRRTAGDLPTIVMRAASDDEPLPEKTKPIGIRVCVGPDGSVTSATTSTSGDVAAKLKASLMAWRFQPFLDGGAPIAVCFSTDVRLTIEAR